MTHDERFAEFVAAKREREAATLKVTWRKVNAKTPRWDGAKYEYGTVDGKLRTACGGARSLRAAKDKAAKLL